jgi:hypothetical protein
LLNQCDHYIQSHRGWFVCVALNVSSVCLLELWSTDTHLISCVHVGHRHNTAYVHSWTVTYKHYLPPQEFLYFSLVLNLWGWKRTNPRLSISFQHLLYNNIIESLVLTCYVVNRNHRTDPNRIGLDDFLKTNRTKPHRMHFYPAVRMIFMLKTEPNHTVITPNWN